MKKLFFLALYGLVTMNVQAQSISNTKNIQVRGVYDFQTEFNEYRMNSFLRYMLEGYGFNVYYDTEELPEEVKLDPCKQLKCIVERDPSMLATKLTIKMVNCKGEVVFMANGESRLKKRNKSHNDAIKNALEYSTLKTMNK